MAHITVRDDSIDLSDPHLVEGLPGVGLVGKIATDHLISEFDMTYYATCRCEGLPRVATYQRGSPGVNPPVRIYADEERDLLALQSDVPVSPSTATEFAGCVTGWLSKHDVTPIYLSGLPAQKDDVPEMYGIGTGDGPALLDDANVDEPRESGLISGPTGALLAEADEMGLDSVGLIVEANPQFPDPEAARALLVHGVELITGVDIDTDHLTEQAAEIDEARKQLAEQMQDANDESSRAQPLPMFQ